MLSVPVAVLLSPKYHVYTVPLGAPFAVLANVNTSLLGAQGEVEVYTIFTLVKVTVVELLPLEPDEGGVIGVGAGLPEPLLPEPEEPLLPDPVTGVGAGVVVDPLPLPDDEEPDELLPDDELEPELDEEVEVVP